MHEPETHYETLGVPSSAQADELAAAFRRAAKRWHPDLNVEPAAEERMKKVAAAYEVLRDPSRRAVYDRRLGINDFGDSDWPAAGGADEPEPWWEPETAAGDAIVVSDPGPPNGYLAGSSWLSPRRLSSVLVGARHALCVALDGGNLSLWAQIGFLCLAACPCVAFFTAGWRGRAPIFVKWGAVYAGANALWALKSGGGVLMVAAGALSVAGLVHAVAWRTRLLEAIDLGDQTRAP